MADVRFAHFAFIEVQFPKNPSIQQHPVPRQQPKVFTLNQGKQVSLLHQGLAVQTTRQPNCILTHIVKTHDGFIESMIQTKAVHPYVV